MATTRVTFNTSAVTSAIAQLKARARPAIARALNRSADSAKTAMVRVIATDMGLKVGAVREFVMVDRATPERLIATFRASAERVPLIDFGAKGPEPSRGKGRGVTAKLKGGAGRYPNAFIAPMRSGHRGVFQRKRGVARLGIYELRGPSIWQSFRNNETAAIVRAHEQLAKNLPHELAFALSKQ